MYSCQIRRVQSYWNNAGKRLVNAQKKLTLKNGSGPCIYKVLHVSHESHESTGNLHCWVIIDRLLGRGVHSSTLPLGHPHQPALVLIGTAHCFSTQFFFSPWTAGILINNRSLIKPPSDFKQIIKIVEDFFFLFFQAV